MVKVSLYVICTATNAGQLKKNKHHGHMDYLDIERFYVNRDLSTKRLINICIFYAKSYYDTVPTAHKIDVMQSE